MTALSAIAQLQQRERARVGGDQPPCPCCGQPLPRTAENRLYRLDEKNGVLRAPLKVVTLSPMHARYIKALSRAYPNTIAAGDLLEVVYGAEARTDSVVGATICKLRKKLRHSGVTIKSQWGVGYRLAREGT